MSIICQIAWIFFSILAGPEEAAWSFPFRELPEQNFSRKDRDKQSLFAHRYGWFSVVVIGIGLSYAVTIAILHHFSFLFFTAYTFVLAFEYTLFFNSSYGVAIRKGIFYLGNTAKTDILIGQKRGKLMFALLVVLIVGLNIALKFIKK